MRNLSISMPPALQSWVEARIAGGEYEDAAEYLRDLVRRDQAEDVRWVRAMIAQGESSGYLDQTPAEIIEEIIAESSSDDG